MDQLNLFDFENEQNEEEQIAMEKSDAHTQSGIPVDKLRSAKVFIKEASVSVEEHSSVEGLTELQVGDQVKTILIDEAVDSETHNYRKYYEPHLIGKVGEILSIKEKRNGLKTYEVNIYGTIAYFEEAELIWIS
jgi:hypothetical protein